MSFSPKLSESQTHRRHYHPLQAGGNVPHGGKQGGGACPLCYDRGSTWGFHTRRRAVRSPSHPAHAGGKPEAHRTQDYKNAFNNIPRQLVLQQLFQHPNLSNFFNMVHWTYATPSFQFFRGSEGVAAVVKSCQGVRQGCVFGSLGFAIATLGMYTQIRDEDPNILVSAILDDLCLSGETQAVFAAFDKLQQLAKEHNIPIQPEKCKVLAPQTRIDSFNQLAQERGSRLPKTICLFSAQWSDGTYRPRGAGSVNPSHHGSDLSNSFNTFRRNWPYSSHARSAQPR